jgi:hypothetical protein
MTFANPKTIFIPSIMQFHMVFMAQRDDVHIPSLHTHTPIPKPRLHQVVRLHTTEAI